MRPVALLSGNQPRNYGRIEYEQAVIQWPRRCVIWMTSRIPPTDDGKNRYGKKLRESQECDLQDGRSKIEAVLQVWEAIVRCGQERRGGPRCQSGFAKLD